MSVRTYCDTFCAKAEPRRSQQLATSRDNGQVATPRHTGNDVRRFWLQVQHQEFPNSILVSVASANAMESLLALWLAYAVWPLF